MQTEIAVTVDRIEYMGAGIKKKVNRNRNYRLYANKNRV